MLPRTSVGSDAFSQLEFAPTNVRFLSEAKRMYNLEKGFVGTLSTARPAAGSSLLVTIRPLAGAFPRRSEHGENKGSDRKCKSSANFAIPDAPCLGERRVNPGDDFGSPFSARLQLWPVASVSQWPAVQCTRAAAVSFAYPGQPSRLFPVGSTRISASSNFREQGHWAGPRNPKQEKSTCLTHALIY